MKKIFVLVFSVMLPVLAYGMDAITKASPKCSGNLPRLSIELDKSKQYKTTDTEIIAKIKLRNTCSKSMSTAKIKYFLESSILFVNGKEFKLPVAFWGNLQSYLRLQVKPREEFVYKINLLKIKGVKDIISKPGKYMKFWRHSTIV